MKTAVLGEPEAEKVNAVAYFRVIEAEKAIIYNAKLLACGAHYGFAARACQPYRANTKSQVERPFRYIRANFFMARSFVDLQDMNRQLRQWLDTVANVRVHSGTQRVVQEHFQEVRPSLQPMPAGSFDAVLRQERRVSSEGCVSVAGNYYSVPDSTRRRILDVETTADLVCIHEDGRLIAVHTLLQGRKPRSILPGHRHAPRRSTSHGPRDQIPILPGHVVPTRPLSLYEQIGRQLAGQP